MCESECVLSVHVCVCMCKERGAYLDEQRDTFALADGEHLQLFVGHLLDLAFGCGPTDTCHRTIVKHNHLLVFGDTHIKLHPVARRETSTSETRGASVRSKYYVHEDKFKFKDKFHMQYTTEGKRKDKRSHSVHGEQGKEGEHTKAAAHTRGQHTTRQYGETWRNQPGEFERDGPTQSSETVFRFQSQRKAVTAHLNLGRALTHADGGAGWGSL
jgi:hypothetical protein